MANGTTASDRSGPDRFYPDPGLLRAIIMAAQAGYPATAAGAGLTGDNPLRNFPLFSSLNGPLQIMGSYPGMNARWMPSSGRVAEALKKLEAFSGPPRPQRDISSITQPVIPPALGLLSLLSLLMHAQPRGGQEIARTQP